MPLRARSDQDIPDLEVELVYRAVDHAIQLRESVDRIADPLLRTLTDTLLFELGRRLARLEGE
ncbi:hypothetical protein ASG60_17720 [Methylobacterium sp. Leaf469]|nr:hypothetical protein ASF22_21010 [Methylobacterium sp. Leaf87]KQP30957.1 hypothetical protein ASF25_19185 [Methylobacterium sp. Leaf100]KQP63904.1 hypothetical protein ASF52_20540 [Methylobacterium sp. Leaf112]KQU02315.1 hypothetical protein ASG60_17720 [Methylobacterium sp. Leaf469]